MIDLSHFQQMVDNLCESKLFFFEKQLSIFLREVAEDEEIISLLKECNREFYFEEERSRFENDGLLPVSKKTLTALVFGYLVIIDNGELRTTTLLGRLFPDGGNPNSRFELFCNRILTPMKLAVCALLRGEGDELPSEKNIILDKMNEDALAYLASMQESLRSDESLEEKPIREMLIMTDGFAKALEHSTLPIQRLLWLGLKNTLLKHGVFRPQIVALEKLFALYGVDMELIK